MKARCALVGSLWLVVAACGSQKTDDSLGSVSGFCAEWGKVACSETVVRRCANSTQECQGAQMNHCLELVPSRLYNESGAEACLDAVERALLDGELTASERDAVVGLNGACSRLLSGRGERGDACSVDSDCNVEDGFACLRKLHEVEGSCQVPEIVGAGRSCEALQKVCEIGFYCSDAGYCIEERAEHEECSDVQPCQSQFRCVEITDGDGSTCRAKIDVGGACEVDDECGSGICRQGVSSLVCARTLVVDVGAEICETFR